MKLSIVDPISDFRLLDYVKIKNEIKGNSAVFRFYTLTMYGQPLDHLVPNTELLNMVFLNKSQEDDSQLSLQFDQMYFQQLLNYEPSFIDLMTLLEAGNIANEVYLLSNFTNDVGDYIISSLCKFFNIRYGFAPYFIAAIEDIDEFAAPNDFTPEGYQNYLNDLQRYKVKYFNENQLSQETLIM